MDTDERVYGNTGSMAEPIRVVVVEDSLTVRRLVVEVLEDAGIQVVGEADACKEAIELIEALRPDLVLLDIHLRQGTGIEVTEAVMARCPTPILIFSASANRGEALSAHDALVSGALELLEKPTNAETDRWAEQLVRKVRYLRRVPVVTHRPPRRAAAAHLRPHVEPTTAAPPMAQLIAIGASTGGPKALAAVLSKLDTRLDVPILVVVHTSPVFAGGFLDWIRRASRLPVVYLEASVELEALRGKIVLAPPGRHMVAGEHHLELTDGPPLHHCRPAVDALFSSLAVRRDARSTLALLLTGMGSDGAQGLLELRRAGAWTVAESESTAVIFGMPAAAIRLGAARSVLPLDELPSLIRSRAHHRR